MPHKMFISAYNTGPLGYLISIPKALCILLAHRLRDSRLQMFLLKWAGALLAVLGAAICGFSLMPMFLAMGVVAHAVCFFAFLLWLATGDLFLKFALEDERFYDLATASHALSVFEDTDCSWPRRGTETSKIEKLEIVSRQLDESNQACGGDQKRVRQANNNEKVESCCRRLIE
jgi:hypothetical protein